jgi:DNA-binding beta-propeller fold protein YncE
MIENMATRGREESFVVEDHGGAAGARLNGRYEPVGEWARLPEGRTFSGDATSVAVDASDNVYVFNRGPTPMLVFDRDGKLLDAWGDGEFVGPHAVALDGEGNLYLVDRRAHFVQKRTPSGAVVFTLGTPGRPAPRQGGGCFNEPTDVAVTPGGDLFITDGYGNSRIHHFDPSGRHVTSWGRPGSLPGEFSLPHGIVSVDGDRLVMCDRENFRLQVFDTEGRFLRQWHCHHPLAIRAHPTLPLLLVAEMGPPPVQENVPNLGNRVTIFSHDGEIVGRFGAPTPGQGIDQFICPHGIAVDSRGDIYVAEVSASYLASPSSGNRTEEVPEGGELPSLRKWRWVPDARD